MSDGIYVALSGAIAQTQQLETTAQNLANANVDGYQKLQPVFREVLVNASARHGAMRLTKTQGTAVDTQVGAVHATGRPLDVALPKGAYLAVKTDAGERYTRAGALRISETGALCTKSGDSVIGANGKPILVSTHDEITLAANGDVVQGGTPVARMKVVSFERPEALVHEGGARMSATPEAGAVSASKEPLAVGSIEESNTSVVGAMTDMITASRSFDAFQKAIDAFREADRQVTTQVPLVNG